LPVADALVYPRHAVRFCHGLWRGARALSGPADARLWGHLGRGKGCGVSLRPFAFQRLTKPFQMDGLKQMLQSAFG
jgi:hypothetical protein